VRSDSTAGGRRIKQVRNLRPFTGAIGICFRIGSVAFCTSLPPARGRAGERGIRQSNVGHFFLQRTAARRPSPTQRGGRGMLPAVTGSGKIKRIPLTLPSPRRRKIWLSFNQQPDNDQLPPSPISSVTPVWNIAAWEVGFGNETVDQVGIHSNGIDAGLFKFEKQRHALGQFIARHRCVVQLAQLGANSAEAPRGCIKQDQAAPWKNTAQEHRTRIAVRLKRAKPVAPPAGHRIIGDDFVFRKLGPVIVLKPTPVNSLTGARLH
jgi:hypothetical protein